VSFSYRIHQCFVQFHDSICAMCFLRQQTISHVPSRMNSLSGHIIKSCQYSKFYTNWQLKFFIISYVNSLERRKYVAFWFSCIQLRLQCLPAQYSYYSYDLTVNSFGKAFAHVRNCLNSDSLYAFKEISFFSINSHLEWRTMLSNCSKGNNTTKVC
jgi:hypothetical protein